MQNVLSRLCWNFTCPRAILKPSLLPGREKRGAAVKSRANRILVPAALTLIVFAVLWQLFYYPLRQAIHEDLFWNLSATLSTLLTFGGIAIASACTYLVLKGILKDKLSYSLEKLIALLVFFVLWLLASYEPLALALLTAAVAAALLIGGRKQWLLVIPLVLAAGCIALLDTNSLRDGAEYFRFESRFASYEKAVQEVKSGLLPVTIREGDSKVSLPGELASLSREAEGGTAYAGIRSNGAETVLLFYWYRDGDIYECFAYVFQNGEVPNAGFTPLDMEFLEAKELKTNWYYFTTLVDPHDE